MGPTLRLYPGKRGVGRARGTHKAGHIDITQRVAEAGLGTSAGCRPMVCGPGDVAISNRQLLHCSFANTSPDWRVTVNFGFHRHSSVLGVKGGGVHSAPAVYDEERIRTRSRVIGYAIDARRQRFPDETPFPYKPFAESGERYCWTKKPKPA